VKGWDGGRDMWIVKLDPSGKKVWQTARGGSAWDVAYSIQQTKDRGYIVAGYTESNNGDVKGNHGGKDCWVVKLNTKGKIEWQKCLGGSKDDIAYGVEQTKDGGYIVGGHTASNNGDVKGNHGDTDFWVVKLNSSGHLIWQKCLGGSRDDIAYSIQQTADEGYVIAGYTYSDDGNVSGHHKDRDVWVVKLGAINCTIAAPDKVCPGSAGNVASAGESGATYAWSITNGTITSPGDGQSITFTAGESGTIRLAVRVTVTSPSKECYYDEGSKDIKIRVPDCNWTYVAGHNDVRFRGPGGMSSYYWEFGDGTTSSDRAPRHIYGGTGIFNVSLRVTSCGSSKTCTGYVDLRPGPHPQSSWTSNLSAPDEATEELAPPSETGSSQGEPDGSSQANLREDRVRIYPG
jgi:hypothetical protein